MKAAVVFNALLVLAAATPLVRRQNIDFDLVDAAPDPTPASIAIGPTAQSVTYDLAGATQSAVVPLIVDTPVEKRKLLGRDACSPEPAGAGPVPSPDTDSAFLAYAAFAASASGAPTPPGYTNTFTNLQASVNAYGYMGYTTLSTYDTAQCATQCSQIDGCYGFNIFFERDPSVEAGAGCMDPPSTTVIKCSFWGGYVAAENALNTGQWRSDFHVVIAGSNGYMTTASPAVDGFTAQSLGNNAINAPLDCNGQDTYMGSRMYTTSTFDPNLCAQTCASTNEFDIAHPPANGIPMICKFFVTYLLSENGVPQGQYCAMYTQPWDLSYATNDGQYRGDDHYTVTFGFSYSNDTSPGLPVCPSDIDYLQSVGGDFCTSYNGYSAPTATATEVDTTYATTDAVVTAHETSTVVVYTTTTATITAAVVPVKRAVTAVDASDYSILIETHNVVAPNKTALQTPTTALAKRSIPTPASITNWEAASISSACSQVATGTLTTTDTTTATLLTTATITVTSTATVSTTTTATATFTVPRVVLPSPTAIVGSLAGARANYDDTYYTLSLPFGISAFGRHSSTVSLSINGRICLGAADSTDSTNAQLPDAQLPRTACVLPYFDDLYIYKGTQQGVYYAISGAVGQRELQFEYYVSHYNAPREYYHFAMTFYEAQPGVVDVKYYSVSDGGASATVGAQDLGAGRWMQFEYNTRGSVFAGLSLRMNTVTGRFERGTFAV